MSNKQIEKTTVRLNMDVPKEWNEIRKSQGRTWSDILYRGLYTEDKIDPALEAELKDAAKHLTAAWNLVKKNK